MGLPRNLSGEFQGPDLIRLGKPDSRVVRIMRHALAKEVL